MDILLRQVSTGNLLYSPNRRSFITKTATTNFKADEFTDPVGKQLQHLGSDMRRMALICCMVWHLCITPYTVPFHGGAWHGIP